MKKCSLVVVILFCVSINLNGQAWNEANFKVGKSPVLGKSTFENIIISEVVNERNRQDSHTKDVYDELANRITEIDGLKFIDREKTKSLLKEFEFQQSSGLVNNDQIRKLGKFLGSGLIAFVRIQRNEFEDKVYSESSFIAINGCKTVRYRKATYFFSINLKLIDLQTAEVVFSKNLVSNLYLNSKKYNCKTPPRFTKTDIYPQCISDIGQKFKNLFVPYEQEYKLTFQKHSKINTDLKTAITYFNINEFAEALSILQAIPKRQKKKKAKSAALYNLALVQYYSGDLTNSLKNAKKAYILNPKNSDCLILVNLIE